MGKIQYIGTQLDLGGKQDQVNDDFSGGTEQMIGSTADLSRRTVPMQQYNNDISGGTVQFIGSNVGTLSRTAHRGWDSYPTPMADAAGTPEESVNSYPSPKAKRGR